MRLRTLALVLLAGPCGCVIPARAPETGGVAPLRPPGASPCPVLGVTLHAEEPSRTLAEYEAHVLRALRTTGLFSRVVAGDPSASLQARVTVRPRFDLGYLPLGPLLSISRVELELDLELTDAQGRTLFEHRGERGWTMVASVLCPFGPYEDPSRSVSHGLVREALARALAKGVFAPWGIP